MNALSCASYTRSGFIDRFRFLEDLVAEIVNQHVDVAVLPGRAAHVGAKEGHQLLTTGYRLRPARLSHPLPSLALRLPSAKKRLSPPFVPALAANFRQNSLTYFDEHLG